MVLRRSLSGSLLALLLAACGGSGGSGGGTASPAVPGSNALLTGTYHVAGVQGEQQGADSIAASWGSATADGAGSLSIATGSNRNGVIEDPGSPESLPYEVASDRLFEFLPGPAGFSFVRGGVTETGDVAVAAASAPGLQPMLLFFGRKSGTYDESSLTGTYGFARYGGTVLGPTNVTGWGSFTFDGAGGGTSQVMLNQEGVIFGPANPVFDYDVAADGGVSFDLGGGLLVEGSIAAGGDLIFATGGRFAGDNPVLYVLVRQGAGYSDADLDGLYFAVVMSHDPVSNAYASFTGVLFADGAGENALLGTSDEDGVVTFQPSDQVDSVVAADGSVTLTTSGGDVLVGGMSADRRFVVAAGTSNAGGSPTFVFLMR